MKAHPGIEQIRFLYAWAVAFHDPRRHDSRETKRDRAWARAVGEERLERDPEDIQALRLLTWIVLDVEGPCEAATLADRLRAVSLDQPTSADLYLEAHARAGCDDRAGGLEAWRAYCARTERPYIGWCFVAGKGAQRFLWVVVSVLVGLLVTGCVTRSAWFVGVFTLAVLGAGACIAYATSRRISWTLWAGAGPLILVAWFLFGLVVLLDRS
ncbi:MAG: hypothetical protein WD206_03935 [Actinomycetota bacterium]